MSVQATTWVWEYSKSKGNARLVLLAIADAADAHGGNAWPSQETVAHMARVSTRTVRRLVTDLEALGELEVLEHAGGTAHTRDDRRPHLYRLIGMPGQNGRTTLSTRIPAGGQAPRHGRTKSTPRADTAVLRTPSLNTLKNNYPSGGTTVPAVAVPDVGALSCSDAADDLVDAGLYPRYATQRQGSVSAQAPTAGAMARWNDQVVLTCGTSSPVAPSPTP
jgi:hypothetical protein